ncbi:hypothetical protein DITRI_Ditri10aG0114500 [Diplodiscus trichospermus]
MFLPYLYSFEIIISWLKASAQFRLEGGVMVVIICLRLPNVQLHVGSSLNVATSVFFFLPLTLKWHPPAVWGLRL